MSELTLEESMILASQIEAIKPILAVMDMGVIFRAMQAFKNQASFERSASVLNSNYNPIKQQLLDEQAECLGNHLKYSHSQLQSLNTLWELIPMVTMEVLVLFVSLKGQSIPMAWK